jgi:acetylornithine deacetylase/succinyl-diaminopimelate desuccinylase-like protein
MTVTVKKKKAELEEELEKALEETFPASDPVTIDLTSSDVPDRPVDRRPPKIDKKLVDALAKKVADKKGAA